MANFYADGQIDMGLIGNEIASFTHTTSMVVTAQVSFIGEDSDSLFGFSGIGTNLNESGGKLIGGTIATLDADLNGLFGNIDEFHINGMSLSFSALASKVASFGGLTGLAYILDGDDTVHGSNFADKLLGFSGADTLHGGKGKDHIDGGAGSDMLDYSDASKGVKVALHEATTSKTYIGGKVEDLVKNVEGASGGSASDHFTGDNLINTFRGLGGNDVLKGGGGTDYLYGGFGHDVLIGGGGNDQFFFDVAALAANSDTIRDFETGVDKIRLSAGFFPINPTDLANGHAFAYGTATETDDRLIYVKSSGKLFYDSDGSNSAHDPVLIANLGKHTDLHFNDFSF